MGCLRDLQRIPLLFSISFSLPDGASRTFVLRQERPRANVLRAITYRGRLRYVISVREVDVTLAAPASAVLDSAGALRRRLPQRLREQHLDNLQHVGREESIPFRARANTQASEQNWRFLNRHAPAALHATPAFLVSRASPDAST